MDLVDFFFIDIEQIPIGVETDPTTFNGTVGFGRIVLSISVECYCDPFCVIAENCACLPGLTEQECGGYSTNEASTGLLSTNIYDIVLPTAATDPASTKYSSSRGILLAPAVLILLLLLVVVVVGVVAILILSEFIVVC